MAKAKRLPSGHWRIRIYMGLDSDGNKVYKSITAESKKEAEYIAASYALKAKSPQINITIGESVDRYISSKSNVLSPSTIESYQKMRRNYVVKIERVKLSTVSSEDVQNWVNDLSLEVSPKTVSNAYGLVRASLSMHRPDLALRVRLPRKVKQLKRILPTSEEVMQAVKGTSVELPVLLALWLCLRMSEVRGVKKSAIHGDTLWIDNVKITVNCKDVEKPLAKTDATRRIVKLPPKLKTMILECDGEYATNLSQKALYSRFTRLMSKAGYEGIRFHDLRHIAASDMNKLGITDRIAADRGGWSSTATMRNVYQHSFSSDRDRAEDIIQKYYESLCDEIEKDSGEETV